MPCGGNVVLYVNIGLAYQKMSCMRLKYAYYEGIIPRRRLVLVIGVEFQVPFTSNQGRNIHEARRV